MISFFKPKNTLLSVAQELKLGIENQSVYLNDHELNEAGYEAHDVSSYGLFETISHVAFLVLPITFVSMIHMLDYIESTHPLLAWLRVTGLELVAVNVAVVSAFIGGRFRSSRKRYITKKSSRR
ncbi:hypothetical protein [Rheinheimera sp. NSM]|uniref:hypothetical protein n=1 Tax=Rheinheimera sp. NSM TaxID=3457884 RepID=UPI0040358D65